MLERIIQLLKEYECAEANNQALTIHSDGSWEFYYEDESGMPCNGLVGDNDESLAKLIKEST